jgi:hypothetical protein
MGPALEGLLQSHSRKYKYGRRLDSSGHLIARFPDTNNKLHRTGVNFQPVVPPFGPTKVAWFDAGKQGRALW